MEDKELESETDYVKTALITELACTDSCEHYETYTEA